MITFQILESPLYISILPQALEQIKGLKVDAVEEEGLIVVAVEELVKKATDAHCSEYTVGYWANTSSEFIKFAKA